MLDANETENEILLGNNQLLLIFLAVAVLLGVAFTGGYMVGRGGLSRTLAPSTDAAAGEHTIEAKQPPASVASKGGGETHTVGSGVEPALESSSRPDEPVRADDSQTEPPHSASAREQEPPLGSRRHAPVSATKAQEMPAGSGEMYQPSPGTRYLQVAAVNRDEAEVVAGVLHRKGFRAHAVPKPGSASIYRVIIGPMKDAGDLSSTRDSLHKSGFLEVIVQNY